MILAKPAHEAQTPTDQFRSWARLTAVAGIAFVALTVIGLGLSGADPSPTGPLDTVRAHFSDNRELVLVSFYLQSLGMVCFLAFAAGLAGLVRRGGADTLGILANLIVTGAAGVVAVSLVVNMAAAALAYRVALEGDPGAVQALFYFYMMVPFMGLPLGAFLAAAGTGILGSGVAPRWLGWVALPPALCLLVGVAGIGDLYGPLEFLGYFGGFLPFLLWALTLSIVLLVRRVTVAAETERRSLFASGERWQSES